MCQNGRNSVGLKLVYGHIKYALSTMLSEFLNAGDGFPNVRLAVVSKSVNSLFMCLRSADDEEHCYKHTCFLYAFR